VHDNGSEFVNRDVAAVIKTHNLIDMDSRMKFEANSCGPRAS